MSKKHCGKSQTANRASSANGKVPRPRRRTVDVFSWQHERLQCGRESAFCNLCKRPLRMGVEGLGLLDTGRVNGDEFVNPSYRSAFGDQRAKVEHSSKQESQAWRHSAIQIWVMHSCEIEIVDHGRAE